MSRIKVNEEDLKQFARIIGEVEDKCSEAIRHLNVDLTSLLSNIPGVSTRRIQDIEATYKKVIHKYREKLDHAQQLVKKTEAAMKQAEKTLAMKAGEFGLEMLGYYDAQRIFSEYDPITGEKVSVGDRLLATGMLALSLIPPAKVAGISGKVAVKGVNAGTTVGFSAFAKNLPTFNSIKNVLNTKKVLEVFKGIYKEVVKAPLSATKLWLERNVKQIADLRLPHIGPQPVTTMGAIPSKTVGEAFGEAKDFFVKMASGIGDNKSVWRDTKGKGKTSKDIIKVSNMDEFFNETEFGKSISNSLEKTKVVYQGQSIYKVVQKTDNEYLKKGYGVYLDALHKDHLEVIDKIGKVKYVLNLDGTFNPEKTKKALGRVVKRWK
jgi:ElaB/YqjD/DUF883 family membrane-anchored ribosome-binding protein